MKSNILFPEDFYRNRHFLGNKTLNLKKCLDWGFNVPKFIALPSYISKSLLGNKVLREAITREAVSNLHADLYIVRSSALIEDTGNQSFAGQFLTKTDLTASQVGDCVAEVLMQADVFLHGDLDKFSLIIQKYVVADISGVTFTRNPTGEREMVIEYGFCTGEQIVSGSIQPIRTSLYWNDLTKLDLPESLLRNQVVDQFKKLEMQNNFPQDVEWCMNDRQLYILQTRPITTISQNQYEQIIFLDDKLPKNNKYFFEKTEVAETISRPSIIANDLAHAIYATTGPVANVYRKYGVKYTDTDFLKIFGNELFIDREKEIQGLLPSYSYLQTDSFTPKFCTFNSGFLTLRNLFFLNTIKTSDYDKIFSKLKALMILKVRSNRSIKTVLENFLREYELVFEINLLSGLSMKKASKLLNRESLQLTEIIKGSPFQIDLEKYRVNLPKNLKGNSLDLSDVSDFIANDFIIGKASREVANWWNAMSIYKQKLMQSVLTEAIIYSRLRELGRWLTVKNVNFLRDSLIQVAVQNKFKNLENIYFSHINLLLNGIVDEKNCEENRIRYENYNRFHMPPRITSSYVKDSSMVRGVSSGLASGVLKNRDMLSKQSGRSKSILYTDLLSPDLVKYFDEVSGIVSNNGGLLSHLAIMAREKNIPVVVGFSMSDNGIRFGDNIQIDGDSGVVAKIQTD